MLGCIDFCSINTSAIMSTDKITFLTNWWAYPPTSSTGVVERIGMVAGRTGVIRRDMVQV